MQKEILEKQADADVRVYAVWFSMLESDSRPGWPRDALTDPRVTHLWDDGRVLGRWYAQDLKLKLWSRTLNSWTDTLWDAYLLYGPDARWTSGPQPLAGWGTTIMKSREELRAKLHSLLRESTKKTPAHRSDAGPHEAERQLASESTSRPPRRAFTQPAQACRPSCSGSL